jgi:bifunctional non-homologous end joining protein LigD
MSLTTYSKKRNFKETPEPGATVAKGKGANSFVIQRHNATRLHYDFRLEVNGVLKSWAIPKGPSLNPTDKRLAVMVEDHPLSYASFKGTIPEGNYGAGIVEIWDKGTYQPEEMQDVSDKEIERHIKNGMLKFSLMGKKVKGSFALVRIHGDESKNWLLIKHRDKYATEEPYSSEEDTAKTSPINKVLKVKEAESPRKISSPSSDRKGGPAVSTAVFEKSSSKKPSANKSSSRKSSPRKSSANKSGADKIVSTRAAANKLPAKKSPQKKVTAEKLVAAARGTSASGLKKK